MVLGLLCAAVTQRVRFRSRRRRPLKDYCHCKDVATRAGQARGVGEEVHLQVARHDGQRGLELGLGSLHFVQGTQCAACAVDPEVFNSVTHLHLLQPPWADQRLRCRNQHQA